jgi:endo-1,4-beta-xylanase
MYGAGGLFNQATVSFYWIDHEPTPGNYRFDGNYLDTEHYWNSLTREQALADRYWRRPAPAPVVDFLKSRDVAIHGHILVWGLAKPFWIYDGYCPENEKRVFDALGIPRHSAFCGATCTCAQHWNRGYPKASAVAWAKSYADTDEAELAQKTPVYAKRLRGLFRNRVAGVAARFGAFADSWDVVNESADDWAKYGTSRTGLAYCFSNDYGLMPGDYQLNAFLDAQEFLPPTAKLAINDWRIRKEFLDQVADLAKEGARVDLVGCQMHLFDTNMCAKLARGETDVSWVGSPKAIRDRLDLMAKTGRRLHVSEVTIAAPGEDEKSRQIQAMLVRNIYRAWFSHPKTMGASCGSSRWTASPSRCRRARSSSTSARSIRRDLAGTAWTACSGRSSRSSWTRRRRGRIASMERPRQTPVQVRLEDDVAGSSLSATGVSDNMV